ncbi:polysaccharide deacetylase family protein [uncultured Bifidobacterium sp.]|uniref:polysaccharide deacetylase family protein n=1 Tax=uncultured Bifidobacterium sp. TaxID=165187 RepID=UPI0027DBFC0F|nr:polysaccharide deacetylase family protein [uncultured Bifidobacterium sp.]
MDNIEKLSFDGIARGVPHHGNETPRRPRRRWPIILAIAVMAALLACGGAWAYWMWDHHWRLIPVRVNDTTLEVRVDTTLGTLLSDNNDFGHKPGRLLAITGEVIDERGGEPMAVTLNDATVAADSFDSTPLPEPATVTVASGGDVTEEHDVRHDPVPHGATIGTGGSIQRLVQTGKDGVREVWVGRSSKQEVDKGVIEQPVDLVVEAVNPRPSGRKVVALTFDDGPSQYTGQILDVLKDKGVKATFFNLGQNTANNAATAQRLVNEGHQLASHSNTHPNMPELGRDEMRADISASLDALQSAAGVDTKTFRAPYGAFGEQQWKDAADLIDMNVLWDIDTLDWQRPGADAITQTVLDNAHNGAIVLMHDGGGDRSQDIEALPGIIDGLREQGYEFVTIKQLSAMV